MNTPNQKESLQQLRHSCAHLLAAAVLELYPQTKLTIGPAIENGFYYDFQFANPLTEDNITTIDQKMRQILKTWETFTKREVTEKEAQEIFKDNPFKLELIADIVKRNESITLYKIGNFEDLCRGGHAENPRLEIGAFKLLHLAGAYWKGDEKNPMLTRIYGTCFKTKQELDEYIAMIEEAKKRDHKKLGIELGLFLFHETAPGMPYWLPKGTIVFNKMLEFSREVHEKNNYQEVITPLVDKKDLYETSGHFQHYWDDMIHFEIEDTEYALKAMNCPNAMVIFGSKTRSYKELPLRLFDTDPLHRNERTGTLNGLFRVREFRQDDAHLFVTSEQIKQEFTNIFALVDLFYSTFNMSYSYRFGTRPEHFMGDEKTWDMAELELENILKESGKEYSVKEKEGAFYGPKIDILMKDSLGRSWQMGTIQLDFQQPKNFNLAYVSETGQEQMPIVIHRAIYGSLERFIGILIEHVSGKFPVWLAPVQVTIIPIADRHNEAAKKAYEALKEAGIRVEIDTRSESMQNKIRSATLQKVPFMGIIGDKEAQNPSGLALSTRQREGTDLGLIPLLQFIQRIKEDIDKKVS